MENEITKFLVAPEGLLNSATGYVDRHMTGSASWCPIQTYTSDSEIIAEQKSFYSPTGALIGETSLGECLEISKKYWLAKDGSVVSLGNAEFYSSALSQIGYESINVAQAITSLALSRCGCGGIFVVAEDESPEQIFAIRQGYGTLSATNIPVIANPWLNLDSFNR